MTPRREGGAAKTFGVFLAVGLAIVGTIVAFTWMGTKGSHLTLEGKILKVRSVATDDQHSIVVVDFRVTNPTKTQFMMKEGLIRLTTADGKQVDGDTIARTDMERVFQYYKLLGPKFNDPFIIREKINGGAFQDRMIGASFALPEAEIDPRKQLTLTLTDIDGAEFTFVEKGGAKP